MTKLKTTQAVDTETNNMIHKVWTLQCMTKLKTTQALDVFSMQTFLRGLIYVR
jgi:hypothetical protein